LALGWQVDVGPWEQPANQQANVHARLAQQNRKRRRYEAEIRKRREEEDDVIPVVDLSGQVS
jgi:hypothetical protein